VLNGSAVYGLRDEVRDAAPIARIVFDYWLLGKAPDGTQPKVNTEDEIE